ncbi:hypothetical protein ACFW2X_04460 [Streptomyces antibioticus]|uniref:hypothetical protein n=1 Tax=Streptomyces antibioticus TaxID=1890 RepID=UPI0036CF039B
MTAPTVTHSSLNVLTITRTGGSRRSGKVLLLHGSYSMDLYSMDFYSTGFYSTGLA